MFILSDNPNAILSYNDRIVAPKALHPDILQKLHLSHPGQVKTKKAAQQSCYWPGMNNDIAQMVQQCAVCAEHLPSQKDTMRNLPISMYPMQLVGINLVHFQNDQYLIMADRYSGYVWIAKMSPATTKSVTDQLFLWFLEYGFPDAIRSGGGPQFRETFMLFCKDHQVAHELASSYNPESNGLAKAAVKSVKFLLEKTKILMLHYQLSDKCPMLMATALQKCFSNASFGVFFPKLGILQAITLNMPLLQGKTPG